MAEPRSRVCVRCDSAGAAWYLLVAALLLAAAAAAALGVRRRRRAGWNRLPGEADGAPAPELALVWFGRTVCVRLVLRAAVQPLRILVAHVQVAQLATGALRARAFCISESQTSAYRTHAREDRNPRAAGPAVG